MKRIIELSENDYKALKEDGVENHLALANTVIAYSMPYEERPQGEYKTACNVLLSLEQIVRKSDGWEDSAVEAVHNAVQTAIKCIYERPQGQWGKWVISEIRCPICLEYFQADCYSTEELNKCPSCGADMRGDENEQ